MCAFRRVSDDKASPNALGILVPPSVSTAPTGTARAREVTVVILRPRALPWDLLLVESGESTVIAQLGREEAAQTARQLFHDLEACAEGANGRMVVLALPNKDGFLLRADVGRFRLITCLRKPGQSYRPVCFVSQTDASDAASRIAAVLSPAPGTDQEYYFNTQHFAGDSGKAGN